MGIAGWVVLVVIVALIVWAIGIYNGLVTLRNRFKNAFSQIDVQLKRRYDLIPNLVESVKGYMQHERERRADAVALDQLPGRQELHRERQHADREVDGGENARAHRRVVGRRRDDSRLLEVEERRDHREQRHPQRDTGDVRRAEDHLQPVERAAAERRRAFLHDLLLRLQSRRADHRELEQRRRHDDEVHHADELGEADGDRRAGERAGAAAGGDEAVKALALLGRVEVRHERPEHGDGEQVEDADPDEKHPRHERPVDAKLEQQPEDGEVGDEEVIDERNEAAPRHARHQRAIAGHRRQHGEKRRGEEPLQVLDAAGDAHLVAQRPQDVIAREQAEEVGERPEQRAHLFGSHGDDPRQPALR